MILNGFSCVMKIVYIIQIFSEYGIGGAFSVAPIGMIVLLGLVTFYIISVYITYQAYAEFKACSTPFQPNADNEANQELASYGGGGGRYYGGGIGGYQPPAPNQPQANNVRDTSRPSNHQAFRGQGVRLGGD